MSSSSVSNTYRLVLGLSLLQLVSGLATICVHGWEEELSDSLSVTAKIFQLTPATYSALTAFSMYRMMSAIHYPASNHFSRVSDQNHFLLYLLFLWSLCVAAVRFITHSDRLSVIESNCLADAFLRATCAPIAMDIVLPYAIIIAVYSASQALRRCALAAYGTELVLMPQGPVLSANEGDSPTFKVPAWKTPHVAELFSGDGKYAGGPQIV
ncbi:hypothetical protein C8R43DRAFT_964096 [Mycena crocata]|nr:hypothetical protein C8R43DRAFT_964096 [Mycena crocata]